jgi:hypothetical protein
MKRSYMVRREEWLGEIGLRSFVASLGRRTDRFLRPNAGWQERRPFAVSEDASIHQGARLNDGQDTGRLLYALASRTMKTHHYSARSA